MISSRSDFLTPDDPDRQGWKSETLHEITSAHLDQLAEMLQDDVQLTPQDIKAFVDKDFACPQLMPGKFEKVFDSGGIEVRRGTSWPTSGEGAIGPQRLATAFRELLTQFEKAKEFHVKFKQFQISVEDETVKTAAYFQASGTTGDARLQQYGLCRLEWIVRKSEAVNLRRMTMENFEVVQVKGSGGPLLSDCTEAVLGRNRCFAEQLIHGQEYWLRRRQLALGIDNVGHHGLAIGDVDGDGLDDIYVCQTGGLPNRLFVQNRDGTASEIAAEAGVDFMERTHSALLVDLDNDGDQDMIATTAASLLVLKNNGQARFELVNEGRFPGAYSLAAADYDHDGDLDFYACFYVSAAAHDKHAGLALQPIPYHDANNGARNLLFRNDGDWRFTDITKDVGLDENNRRWSFAASWEDFDNDGDVDLYVANDYGRNNLYRNDNGNFEDIADNAGVEDIASGMSVAWADANRDGWMDLYVSNMFSAAGNRIAFQRQFHATADDAARSHLQRLARGNTLFINQGGDGFVDVSESAHVTIGRWAWGSAFVDINSDGWPDLVVANGHITNRQPDDL